MKHHSWPLFAGSWGFRVVRGMRPQVIWEPWCFFLAASTFTLMLGCSGDLVSLLSNGPYRAYYGLLWWLIGDTSGPNTCIHLAGCIPEMVGRTLTNPRTLRRSSTKDGGLGEYHPFPRRFCEVEGGLGEPGVKAPSCKPQSAVYMCFALNSNWTC